MAIKNFGAKGGWAYPGIAQNFYLQKNSALQITSDIRVPILIPIGEKIIAPAALTKETISLLRTSGRCTRALNQSARVVKSTVSAIFI